MVRRFNILLGINHTVAFDRRAFEGIALHADERGDVRLIEKLSQSPWPEIVRASKIDGIIVSRKYEDAQSELNALGVPFVSLSDTPTPVEQEYIVAMNEAAIGRTAARHFLDAGYQNLAVCVRPGILLSLSMRIASFIDEVKAAGWPCAVGPLTTAAAPSQDTFEDETSWAAEAGAWLGQLPRPLAVFAPYDYHARVVVNVARSADLRVPDDVAVLGVDNDELYCMTTSPKLSSVITPGRQVGQQALALLLDVLAGKAAPRRTLVDPPGIMLRGSSSDFALEDQDVIAAVRFIRDNAARNVSVDQVAHGVALSRRTLERRFMATLNHTIRDEIRRAKVNRAKRLLIDTDLPYSEIARLSGLVLQQQLNRLIKLDTGQTPVQFRQAARQYRHV